MIESKPISREVIAAGILFLCLLGLSLMTPLTVLAIWFTPIPLSVLIAAGRRTETLLFCIILGIALAVLGLNWAALLFAAAVYGLAIIMGDGIRKSDSPYGSLITATFVTIMLVLVLLALIRSTGINPVHSLQAQLEQSLQLDSRLLGGAGKQNTRQLADAVMTRIELLFPAFVCTFALLVSAVNLYVARWMLRRKIHCPPILETWRLPYWTLPAYLVILILTLSHAFSSSFLWWQVVNNSQFLLGLVIGIQGLSYLWRRLSQYRFGRFWFMLVMLATVVRLIGSVCVLIGLFDLINDSYRRNSNGRGQTK